MSNKTTYKVVSVSEPHKQGYRHEKCKDPNVGYRVDGKQPLEYLTAVFQSSDPTDIKPTVRNISQYHDRDGNATWGTANDALSLKKRLQGFSKEGAKVTRTVKTYDIDGRDVTTYTMVVFEGEDIATMFRRAGHPISEELAVTTPVNVSEPAEELNA